VCQDLGTMLLVELFRLVRSDLSDSEAVESLGDAVAADPENARITFDRVDKTCGTVGPSYETDRARRVLQAAIAGTPPEPAPIDHVELFQREHALARMPLEQAFAELASAVPELDAVRSRANELADAPASFGISIELTCVNLPPDVLPDTAQLVGRASNHADPLVRSAVASTVVSNYVVAVVTGTTGLALWDESRPQRGASLTGSFDA
jgi:hypothetical protein